MNRPRVSSVAQTEHEDALRRMRQAVICARELALAGRRLPSPVIDVVAAAEAIVGRAELLAMDPPAALVAALQVTMRRPA